MPCSDPALMSGVMANGDAAAEQVAPLRPITLEEELRKDPQLKERDVALLRDWVVMQPHLPPVHDRELVLFLHACNYSVEAAKAMVDNHFTLRTHLPELYSQRDPALPEIMNALKQHPYVVLPKRTPDGCCVVLQRNFGTDVQKYDVLKIYKMASMVFDLHMLSEGTSPGVVHIIDLKGLTLGHMARISITALRKIRSLQEVILIPANGLHFINVVPFVDKLMQLIKPFLKSEVTEVIHLHAEDSESIYEFLPKDILPEDCGGSAPSFNNLVESTRKALLANREFFLEEEQRRVDEEKRPGRPRSAEDLFGVEGTFRTLDID